MEPEFCSTDQCIACVHANRGEQIRCKAGLIKSPGCLSHETRTICPICHLGHLERDGHCHRCGHCESC